MRARVLRPVPGPLARVSGAMLVLVLATVAACAGRAPTPRVLAEGARLPAAMLPIENLSSRSELTDRLQRMVWTAFGSDGRFEVVDPGQVENAMTELRIRSSASLSKDQITRFASGLGVRWLVAGDVLECGTVHTPDGDVPSFALALRLIDGTTGRVRWTDMLARSGEDRETVFGWGRETSIEKLMDRTARELIARIRVPSAADSLGVGTHR